MIINIMVMITMIINIKLAFNIENWKSALATLCLRDSKSAMLCFFDGTIEAWRLCFL